ncbi:saccharopine dehydrogenase [Actinokineospora pegani]|uniref:saccharopine dehydrogenase n=1 Tax=Actinokineospora pegani TaxID=2654637 RepID=UPI0012EA3C2D|nr:saccharopine dehydrogenase [Actinokineospora pegani]
MTPTPSLWIRNETRPDEQRTPVVPEDARRLVEAGVAVTVEDSAQRVFALSEYVAAGCATAEPGSWVDAPADQVVVGLKELPDEPDALRHRHVFFGHAFKAQPGGRALLDRFARGGGQLLDLEYLTNDAGRRLTAFGYWAGYAGAALGVLQARGGLSAPLASLELAELEAALARGSGTPSALVIGARGRCGRGAQAALKQAGITPTTWDRAETLVLDRPAILGHDLLVNAVYTATATTPFLTPAALAGLHRLSTVVDVTCDAGSPQSVLPIYDEVTTWTAPVARRHGIDLIAIDNLPSLLPREASTGFSADLTPLLTNLDSPEWRRAADLFAAKVAA